MLFVQFLTEDPAFYVVVLFTIVCSVTLHELGHAVFNLADEYAGLNYDSSTDFHNNYSSLIACSNYTAANGWPTSDCRQIKPGWWRSEPSGQNCIMLHGQFSPVAPQYGPSCLKRVDWIYNQLP